jgi:hypothetical protein
MNNTDKIIKEHYANMGRKSANSRKANMSPEEYKKYMSDIAKRGLAKRWANRDNKK